MNAGFMAIFPLTFLSNVFVDPETLPSALEAFVDVNPISILATASRGLMEGNADGTRHRDRAGRRGRADRGVRAAHDPALPQPRLAPPVRTYPDHDTDRTRGQRRRPARVRTTTRSPPGARR